LRIKDIIRYGNKVICIRKFIGLEVEKIGKAK